MLVVAQAEEDRDEEGVGALGACAEAVRASGDELQGGGGWGWGWGWVGKGDNFRRERRRETKGITAASGLLRTSRGGSPSLTGSSTRRSVWLLQSDG